MKEYLKMSDVFKVSLVPVANDDDSFSLNDGPDDYFELAEFYNRDECEYSAHAINSHDELVENMNHYKAESEQWESRATREASRCAELMEMNKELLEALEGVIDYLTFDGFGGRFNSIREDVDLTDGLKKFMDVIAKAKGEQQSQPNALRDDVYVAGGKV